MRFLITKMIALSVAALITVTLMLSACSGQRTIHPLNPRDLKEVSAEVLMERSGGSSTILRSSEEGSEFLTNAHVCDGALKSGALIVLDKKVYEVAAIKPSERYDLCLMRINENLGIGVELSSLTPQVGDDIMVGGYPVGLPIIIQKGHISEVLNVSSNPIAPIYAIATSVVVQPGYSGSGVFNSQGQLVAVSQMFRYVTKKDTMGFGLAVPHQYVRRFINQESEKLPWKNVPRAIAK